MPGASEKADGRSEASPLVVEDETSDDDLDTFLGMVNVMIRPVAVTMAMTSLLARVATPAPAVLWSEDDEMSTTTTLEHASLNTLWIIASLLGVTCLVLLMYWLGCVTFLKLYLMVSVFVAYFILGGYLSAQIFSNVATSIVFPVIVGFVSLFGVIAIFAPKTLRLPSAVTRGAQIILAVVVAWNFSAYPRVTSWLVLGALAIYDILVVLTPCGPLSLLVDLIRHRGDPLPGLLYDASSDDDHPLDDDEQEEDEEEQGTTKRSPRKRRSGFSVGLGDFIFFSVLVSDAGKHSFLAAVTASLACLVGMTATLALLVVYQRPLPALPISIALGLSLVVTTDFVLEPMLLAFQQNNILI